MLKKYILVLNAGSATLKFKIFEKKNLKERIAGNFERIGLPDSFLIINKKKWSFGKVDSHEKALNIILKNIKLKPGEIKAIGHRVVHGGEEFFKPAIVQQTIWKVISKYNQLAPVHNPAGLTVIKACYKLFPRIKNIAVFDTAFFKDLKPENYLYALPTELYKRFKTRKYGFHGISHCYVAKEAAKLLKKSLKKLNLITCHLGNGCSICAIKNGKPIEISMGFTPLEGLVMGTRSGDIDPTLPLFLQNELKFNPNQVYDLLNKKSGLLGLSGFSSDMREILKAAGHPVKNYHGRKKFSSQEKKRARLALSVFMNRLRFYISGYAGILGKVDAVVFTGGIGERSATVRTLALKGLELINKPIILVIKTDEELEIAREIRSLI
jgi:acetate kinase